MRPLPIITGVALAGGAAAIFYRYLTADAHTFKEIVPDEANPPPGKTGWRRVDALLPTLRALAQSNGIPLGLLVGWIAKESGGKLAEHPQPGPGDTSMDERGYFQLSPEESKRLGLDHQRLSTDSDYSLSAGIKLIRSYEPGVQALRVAAAPMGSAFYWRLVKLHHTVGGGQTKKWMEAAQQASAAGSWSDFEAFVLSKSWRGPQPKKWLPFMDALYRVGKPFGFGDESAAAVAGDTRLLTARHGLDIFAIGKGKDDGKA